MSQFVVSAIENVDTGIRVIGDGEGINPPHLEVDLSSKDANGIEVSRIIEVTISVIADNAGVVSG